MFKNLGFKSRGFFVSLNFTKFNSMKKDEIKKLKAEHGTIYRLDIPTAEGEETLILKSLDRVTYSAGAKIMEKDELQAAELFLRSLTVGGTVDVEEIIKDFNALRAAAPLLVEIIAPKVGNVTKL